MDSGFITYQRFNDPILAEALANLLEEHEIPYLTEEEKQDFDPAFAYRADTTYYAVKIRSTDFVHVNQLLKTDAEKSINEVDADYYLLNFTDKELRDVVLKADEWSAFDVLLARKLLAERGKAISDQEIKGIEDERLQDLSKPEKHQSFWIATGYFLAFLGGILSIFIGWHLAYHKKTLPNGEQIYAYSESDRNNGRVIFCISIVSVVFWALFRIIRNS